MTEPRWLDASLVVPIHGEQLAMFGGPAGLRDPGLLESALARPINRWAYGTRDLVELAATLFP